MRRRSRHASTSGEPPDWPAKTADDGVDTTTQSEAALDDALRALARLLARQAARDIFERECAHGEVRLKPDTTTEDTCEDLPLSFGSSSGSLLRPDNLGARQK